MLNRREWLTVAGGAAFAVKNAGKTKLDRSRFSVMTDEVGPTLKEAIAFAKQYKLTWVELRGEPGGELYERMPVGKLKEAASLLSNNGLRVSFLNSALLKFTIPGTTPLSTESHYENMYKKLGLTPERMMKDRMSSLRQAFDAAQALGCDRVRAFTFWRVKDPASVRKQIIDIFNEMGELAARYSVHLLIENETSTNIATSAEAAALLDAVKSPWVGLNWDPQNSVPLEAGVFPSGYKLLPKDRIGNVQMKAEGLIGKEHPLDWGGILKAMVADGYRGRFGLETHTLKGPAVNTPASHECLNKMLSFIDEG